MSQSLAVSNSRGRNMHNNSLQSNPFNWCFSLLKIRVLNCNLSFIILWCFVVILIQYDANLKFTVLDQNDNKPIFSQGSYTFTGKPVSRTCACMDPKRSVLLIDGWEYHQSRSITIGIITVTMIMFIVINILAISPVPETEPAGQTVFTGVSLADKDSGTNSQVGGAFRMVGDDIEPR